MSLDDVPDQIGPYRLERKIGAGGMGVVYLATDTLLERPVAIKMMHGLHAESDDADELRSRFLLEARTAARIKSRHVVQILQLGILPPATIYIVMEFLDGTSLNAELKREGALPVARAVRIASEIAEAMALAHDLNVVHRDLKPANVMLVKEGAADDVVKVLDFGIAKLTTTSTPLTQAGVVLGTLAYMAPEQIDSQPLDGRTDLYALGMILYRMLTGCAAYDSESAAELVHLQRTVLPTPPSVRAPERRLPRGLDDVVMRCLQKRPDDRLPSMRALIEALRPFRDLADAPAPGMAATLEVKRPELGSIATESEVEAAAEPDTGITSDVGSAVFTMEGVRPVSPLSMAATVVSSRPDRTAVGNRASPSAETDAPLAETATVLPAGALTPSSAMNVEVSPPGPVPSSSGVRIAAIAAVVVAVVVGAVVTLRGDPPARTPPAPPTVVALPPAAGPTPTPTTETLDPTPTPTPTTPTTTGPEPTPTTDPTPTPTPTTDAGSDPPPPAPTVAAGIVPPPPPPTTPATPTTAKKKPRPKPPALPAGFEPVHTLKAP